MNAGHQPPAAGHRVAVDILLLAAVLCGAAGAAAQTSGLAIVQNDGSLRIKGRTVHLWGIHVPATYDDCRTSERPPKCGSRAALALEFEIDGFVHCEEKHRRADGSVEAVCHADRTHFDEGTDLAAYLLARGWAVARPDAPIEYQTLERIARETGLGVWGLPRVVEP